MTLDTGRRVTFSQLFLTEVLLLRPHAARRKFSDQVVTLDASLSFEALTDNITRTPISPSQNHC